jgi:hypothetical protein
MPMLPAHLSCRRLSCKGAGHGAGHGARAETLVTPRPVIMTKKDPMRGFEFIFTCDVCGNGFQFGQNV